MCGRMLSQKSVGVTVKQGRVEEAREKHKKFRQNLNEHFLFHVILSSALPCYFPPLHSKTVLCKRAVGLWVVCYLHLV